ncbi:MAG: Outer membrane efflux protein BepC [Alphaproteobacteria bacterium MarineAlpha3_Bin4]|nr:MAG: Outer membrane efflux protein BepC [Alphaproteobacteria bacterium MarineAlpha3_Bin4]
MTSLCICPSKKRKKLSARISSFMLMGTLLIGAADVFSGAAQAQTLSEALTSAYLNNPTLLSQRASLRASDEGVPQALGNWRPSVSLTGDAGKTYDHNATRSTGERSQNRTPIGYGINISQTIYRGGRTPAEISGAENTVRAARARLLSAEQDVLLDAATSYMNVFRDEAVLRLNVSNEQVLVRQLEATRDRFEVGEITRTDVNQGEARLAGATADRIQSEGDLEASRAAYHNVIGKLAPRNLKFPEQQTDVPDDKEEVLKAAVTKNPNVISAEFDLRAALDRVDGARGELLPEVDVSASLTRDFQSSSEISRTTVATVTLNVDIPLYQQGQVFSGLRRAKQDAAASKLNIDQARRDATEAAASAWESLKSARARVNSSKTQIEANNSALEGVQQEAAVGSRTVLDVLDAEQELRDSRVAHVRAQSDQIVAIFELKASIGQLTARALKLPVELYNPKEHYRAVRDKWIGGSSKGGME